MKIIQLIDELEAFAPLSLQDEWDNSGLQVGDVEQTAGGVLLCLDVTEDVLDEAIELGCNLIISHHPLLFKPLRSISDQTYIERCVVKACKNNLVIYAAHTNLDNAHGGVNFHLAEKIGLQEVQILRPHAGVIAGLTDNPTGSGVVGTLLAEEDEESFLQRIKDIFHLNCLKYSPLTGKKISKVAICGGGGAFLLPDAIACGADAFLTGEAKYNHYYDVENHLLLAVLGHYESEICTKELFFEILSKKITNFAVHFSNVDTNPVNYM
ncbi:hypothetical protein SAMD00024442_26_28 [Candidatus Symbiothrix dinenymphae]|nr:hypothetical protein SAMD00024442_26_28 [Candidatus Symbiothrix dinenymphae]